MKALFNGVNVVCKYNGVDVSTGEAPVVTHNYVMTLLAPSISNYRLPSLFWWSHADATVKDNGVDITSTSKFYWTFYMSNGTTLLPVAYYNVDPTLLRDKKAFEYAIKTSGTFILRCNLLDSGGNVVAHIDKSIVSSAV